MSGDSSRTRSPWSAGTSPLEDELASRAAWLIRIRWLAGFGVLAGCLGSSLWGIEGWHLGPWVCLCGLGIWAYNALFVQIRRRLRRRREEGAPWSRFASAQFLTDWGALILLVHLTGGIASPILFFFVFHAIIASILLPPRASFGHSAVGVLAVVALAVLEGAGLLPHHALPFYADVPYDQPLAVAMHLAFFALAILGSTYLAGSVARRLWARTVELLRLNRDVELAYDRTRTLYDITRAVNSTLSLPEVLDTLVTRAVHAMGVRAGILRLLDPESGRLRLSASFGLSEEYLRKGDVDPEKSPVDQSVLQGWAVQVPDIGDSASFQYPEEALREGLRSVLVCPVTLRGRVIGVMRLYGGQRREFTEEEIAFAMAIAAQGAVAIENARAYRNLEELEEAKARFIFQVLHELKSPVAALRSSLAILQEGFLDELDERKQALVARMVRRVNGLQDLLRDLMELGAMKGRPRGRPKGRVDVREVVREVLEGVAADAEAKGIRLVTRLPEEPLEVQGSPDDLEKVCSNLVHNAVKYTPPEGTVEVTLVRTPEGALFVCRDTGIGMDEAAKTQLFREFYRAGNAKHFAEGTGLGLVLVKRLVDLYDGAIEVESRLNEGSTFRVRIPFGEVPPEDGGPEQGPGDVDRPPPAS